MAFRWQQPGYELTWEQIDESARIGYLRWSRSQHLLNKAGKEGKSRSEERLAAQAEVLVRDVLKSMGYRVGLALGRSGEPVDVFGMRPNVVGAIDVEVRWASQHNRQLLLRPKDQGHWRYMLVTGRYVQDIRIHGWAYGWEVKTEDWVYPRDSMVDNERPQMWLMPSIELHPLSAIGRRE